MSIPEVLAAPSPLLHLVPSRVVPTTAAVSRRRAPLLEDSLLPEPGFGPRATGGMVGPEAALIQAVLEDALLCPQGHFSATGRRGRRLAQEAEAWFLSEEVHRPFVFRTIGEVLGLEPVAVRQALLHDRASWRSVPLKKIRRSVTAPRALRLHG